ncbi:glycosyltransferase [Catenovulum sp. 2E275]|uniref:glycosyltransferase n=1 Tax=Catenovulum sp. 2E275 TaxID=2980497 RepID=UPI0021D2EA6B|nr:glycosyltransferase [Catenovulum sp. 2E275]MCU4674236.1 glycosyltransferase [Catenovulum sp. 2E275]
MAANLSPSHSGLKIFHVLFSRGFAGSERSTAESCNQQCQQHDVTLIIRTGHTKNGASIRPHLDPKVKVIEISNKWFTRWRLNKLIKQYKPDIIHCHLRRSTRVISKINPPVASVSTLHIRVNGQGFNKMTGLICNARWQIKEIENTYSGLIFKANNSLVPHPPISQQQKAELRQSLGLNDNDYLIAAVGRYHASKAWDTLIKAFKQVPTAANVKLKFFGSGSLENELKHLAKGDPRIEFVGFRKDIKDLYQCFDLLVCPSRFEPLPRVMLEAYDGGVPIIASDEGGCKELIEDYGGYLFKVDNIDQLSEQLKFCIEQKPARYKPDLTAHYVTNANAQIVEFYHQCIAAKSAELSAKAIIKAL